MMVLIEICQRYHHNMSGYMDIYTATYFFLSRFLMLLNSLYNIKSATDMFNY